MQRIKWLSVWILLAVASSLASAERQADPGGGERPEVRVQRLTRAPRIDDFLDMRPPADLATELAHVTGFIQREPADGRPASQHTDVFLGYDDRNFYAIFVAFDEEPDKLRAHITRREDVFGDDIVEIQLDTFLDERRAFSFLCNPHGIQWDAIWTEGQGFDTAWDTVWQSRGQITDRGYVVWMSIPFKSLRFRPEDAQTWGLVLVRDTPRTSEETFWPRISNRIEGRLNQAATLTGVQGISPGRNIWLIPFSTAARFRALQGDGTFVRDSLDTDLGVDAKFVLRDSLALDLTVNPDFSQVESDQPQVTLNERFEVFFPERRPFFLENAGFFQTPINLLFTRRIVEPRLGARLTGRVGKYSLGLLATDDEAPGEAAEIGVVRVSRDIGDQSTLGMLLTRRELDGDRNNVAGVDGRVKLGDNWVTRFQWVHSETRTETATGVERTSDPAASVELNRDGRHFGAHIHYQDVGKDFNSELGFVPRRDQRNAHTRLAYTFRPEGKRLLAWGPSLFVERIEDHEGIRLDRAVRPGIEWSFSRQTSLGLFAADGRERLRPGDVAGLTQPLDFETQELAADFQSRFFRSVNGGVFVSRGRRANFSPAAGQEPAPVDVFRVNADLTLRPAARLLIRNSYLLARFEDRSSGQLVARNQIGRTRVSWQFNPRLSLRLILQWERTDANPALTSRTAEENINGDVLLTYLINPWTALYVGYTGNQLRPDPLGGTDWRNDARQVFTKFSYLLRF